MDSMEIDSSTESVLRTNSIWLNGVDNLSTAEIKDYVKKFVENDFKIEWINDSSLNIVFENDEDATDALKKLALDQEKVFEATDEREAQKFDKPEVLLTLRMSNLSDKKVKNAAQYSRYYLYNPPKHETERRRKPRSKGHGSDYREREPVVFKRTSRSEDDDDGIDLFPDKAASIVNKKEIRDDDKDVVVVDQQESQSDNDLFSSKLLEDKRPKSASLLERIGSKSSDKIK